MTFNEALGFTVNQYLFARRVTRERLGELLGVTRTVVSKKVRGHVGWTAEDLARTAEFLGIKTADLLPTRTDDGWTPAAYTPASTTTRTRAVPNDNTTWIPAPYVPASRTTRTQPPHHDNRP